MEKRIQIINTIVEEIASRGRGFFRNKKDGSVAKIFLINDKICMLNEFNKQCMYLDTPNDFPPEYWSHGGTMWGLVKDFRDFIKTGDYTNHDHGYGGLYCPHWGYSKEDMLAIQEKAVELGYLNK